MEALSMLLNFTIIQIAISIVVFLIGCLILHFIIKSAVKSAIIEAKWLDRDH